MFSPISSVPCVETDESLAFVDDLDTVQKFGHGTNLMVFFVMFAAGVDWGCADDKFSQPMIALVTWVFIRRSFLDTLLFNTRSVTGKLERFFFCTQKVMCFILQ